MMNKEPFDGDLAPRLRRIVDDGFLDRLFDKATGSGILSDSEMDRVRRYARVKVEGLQSLGSALADPEDAEELYDSLITLWIELRSEWARYNKTVNYRRLIQGQEDGLSSALGGVCSNILAAIEPLFPGQLHRLTEFASSPLLAMARPGRFADTNVVDQILNLSNAYPLIVDLAEMSDVLREQPEAASKVDWQIAFANTIARLKDALCYPGIPCEVAKVAVEERLLRFGERNSLPLAPRVQIAGADRIAPQTVAEIIDSLEELFESMRGALATNGGPVRSHANFDVDNEAVTATVSVLPSFFVDSEQRQSMFGQLKARGLDFSFDANAGFNLKYEVVRAD